MPGNVDQIRLTPCIVHNTEDREERPRSRQRPLVIT